MTTRHLLLMRHAEAGRAPFGQGDHARPLTDHGLSQALDVGRLIATGRVPAPQRALVSDATRTQQTWDAVAQAAGLDVPVDAEHALYGIWPDELLARIRATDDAVTTLAVVGHAPEIPDVVSGFTAADGVRLTGWPTASLGVVTWDGAWADLDPGAVLSAVYYAG